MLSLYFTFHFLVIFSVDLVNVTGKYVVSHFKYPRIWHVLYVDGYTCSPGRPVTPVEQPNYIQYDLQLVNPDSLGNPTEHFSDEETGMDNFLSVALFLLHYTYIVWI